MELADTVAIFKRSLQQNWERYTQYLEDGDSKAFKQVVDSESYEMKFLLKNLSVLVMCKRD